MSPKKSAIEIATYTVALKGKNYTKRDYNTQALDSSFPRGEDFKNEFQATFLAFESFATDAVNLLQDSNKIDEIEAQTEFVLEIMKPLYENCQTSISNYLVSKKEMLKKELGIEIDKSKPFEASSLVWYACMQPMILSWVKNLSD